MTLWQFTVVSTIVLELDQLLKRMDPPAAKVLETKVRKAMSDVVDREIETPTLEEIKRRRPDLADIIGCWADVEFELPPELPLPPAKTW